MLIAYCGLTCDTCPIHLATLEPDPTRQKVMRDEIAKMCREQYGMNLQTEEITDCDGCSADGRLFAGCVSCEIRKCAIERKLESCAYCDDYICSKLTRHFETDPSARARLDGLRNGRQTLRD